MRWSLVVVSLLAACSKSSDRPDAAGLVDAVIDAPIAVTLTVPLQPTNPADYDFIVAYQDGREPWTRAPAATGDDYVLPIQSDRYGVLVACTGSPPGSETTLRIVQVEYFTVAEATHLEMSLGGCGDPRAMGELHGSLSNIGSAPAVGVAFDAYFTTTGSGSTYELPVSVGTHDLIAYSTVTTAGDTYADRMLVRPDVQVAGDQQLDIDFATAAPTVQHHVLGVTTGDFERLYTQNYLYTSNGTIARLSSGTDTFYVSPAAVRRPGDLDRVEILFTKADYTSWQRYEQWGAPSGDITPSLPTPLSGLACTNATSMPGPRVHVSWTPLSADRYLVGVRQTGAPSLFIETGISKGYLGAVSSWDAPDLTAIAGWPAAYQLTPGVMTTCALEASIASTGPSEFASVKGTPGAVVRTTAANLFYVP